MNAAQALAGFLWSAAADVPWDFEPTDYDFGAAMAMLWMMAND